MLDPVYGSQNFAYAVSPGTMTGTGMTYGVANANPYLGLGMGINNITANKANPYGAIPGFSHLGEATNYVTNTLNNTPFATGVRNIASSLYDSTLGNVMNNDVGRNIHNLASMPMNALSGTTNLVREGYQALDRNVFGNLLPGGADSEDAESLQFDNPYANLQENIKKIGERKDEIVAGNYIENFTDWEKGLAEELQGRGYSVSEAVDAVRDPSGLTKLQELKIESDPTFGGLTKEEMSRFTQLANEETKVVFKDGSDLQKSANITPEFKLEGITQAELDAIDAQDLISSGLLADLDSELTSQSIDTIKNQVGMGTDYEQVAQDALNVEAERARLLQDVNRYSAINSYDPLSSMNNYNFSNNIQSAINTPTISLPTYTYDTMTSNLGGGSNFRQNLSYGNLI